ncbi:MAG: nucleotidyltransferase domain-containing protein [Thermoanaerobaculia bacterium]|nr:nucleotidyltransferase domain-containing protein [Thermoanaerobaculia bacterium]
MKHEPHTRDRQDILDALYECAEMEDVHILYACESGSRAWGFPALDSDYDVRFIYAGRLNHYLTVTNRRDVIERPIDQGLDLGGWDLHKCLALLRSGNGPLLEWLVSPIVYETQIEALEPLRQTVASTFRPLPIVHHYLGLTRGVLEKMHSSTSVPLKTYCYALRAVLAASFVTERQERPPMTLEELLDAAKPPESVVERIASLLEKKAMSVESDRMLRDQVLDDYLTSTFQRVDAIELPRRTAAPSHEPFDLAFRETLRRLGELG